MMIQAVQLRKGMVVKIDNVPHSILSVDHITPGNWRAMIQVRLRNLINNLSKEIRFRSFDRIEQTEIEEFEMEYLYYADDAYVFMNTENYEQIAIAKDFVGDDAKFLTPNMRVGVEIYEGKPFGIVLPKTVTLKVVETSAHIKDATAQAQLKPATLEGGHTCGVPPFIEVGDLVIIDTESGEYLERA